MRTHFFGESPFYISTRGRNNPNIEMPTEDEPFPIPPDQEHGPPVNEPVRNPDAPEDQPDPTPIREPGPKEPTRLV